MTRTGLRLGLLALLSVVAAAPAAAPVAAQAPEPYRDPAFTCEVHDYGADPPTLPAPPDDPLCVRYDKTNITLATLEVIDFLAAEPDRVAIVAGKCRYWQQDHWIVSAAAGTTPLVEWEGSYWYDGLTGSAGGIFRDLRVGGQPADGEAFAAAIAMLLGEEAADQVRPFLAEGGGGGATFDLPEGFGIEQCAGAEDAPTPDVASTTTTSAEARSESAGGDSGPTARTGGAALPATGAPGLLGPGLALVAVAAALRRFSVHDGAEPATERTEKKP